MPGLVWMWMAQLTSSRPLNTPPCSVKPGRLTPALSSRSSSIDTFTRLEAVISV